MIQIAGIIELTNARSTANRMSTVLCGLPNVFMIVSLTIKHIKDPGNNTTNITPADHRDHREIILFIHRLLFNEILFII